MPDVRTREVLQSVLLQTLSKYSSGLDIHGAYDDIERNFTLPQEWYREIPTSIGYKTLQEQGKPNWQTIPQEQLVQLVPTEPQWQNEIRWSRNDLRKAGYLDTSAPRGVWKLTRSGFSAAGAAHESLTPEERHIATPRSPVAKQNRTTQEPAPTTSREALEQKLNALVSSMPLADLELVVDIARVIRLRSLEG